MTDDSEKHAKRLLTAILGALVAASIAFRVLVLTELEHTSLVFIGIPALLAFMVLHTRPRTAIGTVNKVIAIALCLSGVIFGEALVCILMAAPIFFLIGTLVGLVINWIRGSSTGRGGSSWRGAVSLVIVPLGLEGVMPGFEFDRDEHVIVSRVVDASPHAVRNALAETPRFDRTLPPFLRLGFPAPAHASGSGLDIGDRRSVMMLHGEHHNGAVVFEVSAAGTTFVRFMAVSDSTYVTHWLAWQDATVRWEPVDNDRTRVTWELRYRRRLDPAWYFVPLERYGVSVAAGYLIETLATPRGDAVPGHTGRR
ncbi:MAG TPA: hypothetical protein VFZ21_21235 [Gemmatimonadaceae bacterium]|nr:hypothetical protein [Gemmatimonadaceae bacterium]